MQSLFSKTVFITGATRGIGREIALRCARDGANIVLTGKTVTPHPHLPGTLQSVANEVEAAGGKALALQLDVRNEAAISEAVTEAAKTFGGIDILVNNASAIALTDTANTPMKRFDLMMSVNMRATFACTQACLPYLKQAKNPHVLTLSPPPDLNPKWFARHTAYTISKYGMSLCTLGMAAEFASAGIAVNSLWPRTTIATAAIAVNFPEEILRRSRKPSIVADAAYAILTRDAKTFTGQFCIDEKILRDAGITDFTAYAIDPKQPLFIDLFLEE